MKKTALKLALLLSITSHLDACAWTANAIDQTQTVAKKTQQLIGKILTSTAQGADLVLYPALTYVLGNALYKSLAPKAVQQPVACIEKKHPLIETTRHAATSLVVGALTLVVAQQILNSDSVNEFISTNMPNLSTLLISVDALALDAEQDIDDENDVDLSVEDVE